MSGRPVKYLNEQDRINAIKAQSRKSYEKNKEKYKPRANLRAKRTYWRNKLKNEQDEDKRKEYQDKIDELTKILEGSSMGQRPLSQRLFPGSESQDERQHKLYI